MPTDGRLDSINLSKILNSYYMRTNILSFQVLAEYVNALLNTKGGILVFGVEPNGKLHL